MNDFDCEAVRMSAMAATDGEAPLMSPQQIQTHLQQCAWCQELVTETLTAIIPDGVRRQRHEVDLWPTIHKEWSARQQHDVAVAAASRRRTTWFAGAIAVAVGILLVAGVAWWQWGSGFAPMAVRPRTIATSIDVGSLIYEIPWKAPPAVTVEQFRQEYSPYFEPEFQASQGERVPPDLDVNTLQSILIRIPIRGPNLGTLFIDRTGEVVLALPYPSVQPFTEGLAAVAMIRPDRRTYGYGFVDQTGDIAIPLQFDGVEPFHEGMAPVQVDEKWGFIDRQGAIVIPPRYRFTEPFQNGIARAHLQPEMPNDVEFNDVQIIDRQGNVLFTTKSRDTKSFSEGLMHVNLAGTPGIDHGRAVGYVDSTFSFAFRLGKNSSGFFPLRCEEFHDGMAAVEVEGSNQWGFIDRKGKLVVPGPFFQVMPFSEGLAAVKRTREMDATWGYIDRTGNFVIGERFFKVTPFAEGLAAVLLPLNEPNAPDEESAGSGLPRVKWGYIDQQGRTVIEPRFYEAKPFRHGLAEVKESPTHRGFIDQTGKYVWEMILPGQGGHVQ